MPASVKSVYLSDFQSHVETKIDLAPPGGLTIIVGPTDSGKTAIVRALRLLYYNVPTGAEFVRVGRDKATVAVELSDGTKVARERSKSINRYRIVKQGESPQTFEGFGLSVPLEVQEVTGVRTVSIGESLELALNLSEQLDGPFLGNKVVSGPARAKILGSLAGTEEVDAAHSVLGTDLLHATQDATRLENEIKDLDARIAEYAYLPQLAEQIEVLDAILVKARAAQARLKTLEECAAKIDDINTQRAQALATLARWSGLQDALSHVEYAQAAHTRLSTLVAHKTSLDTVATQRAEAAKRLVRWARLDEGVAAYDAAQAGYKRLTSLISLNTDLEAVTIVKERASGIVRRWANLDVAEESAAKCAESLSKLQRLVSLNSTLQSVHTEASAAIRIRNKWGGLAEAEEAISVVSPLLERLTALAQASNALQQSREARVLAENSLSAHSKALGDAQSLYADMLTQMGVCPVCGSRVDPKAIKLHIEEVA